MTFTPWTYVREWHKYDYYLNNWSAIFSRFYEFEGVLFDLEDFKLCVKVLCMCWIFQNFLSDTHQSENFGWLFLSGNG